MKEVAAAAGVSLATVSRVLSGDRPGDDEIAARVREAAAALDFRPNPSAQGLRRPVSAVGVVVPDLANPYFAEVLKGVNAAAEEAGRRMLVADAHEDPAEEVRLVRELIRWSAGIILCSPRMRPRDLATVSAAVDRPFVTTNRPVPGHPSVVIDFAAGIRQICDHLREFGHEHVVYLGGPALAWSDGERRRALRAEARRGLRVDFLPCGAQIPDGHAATDAALATGATAIVAFSDYVAMGVLMRAAELGVRIPDDLSVTGFDDIPVGRIAGPGLTTASISKTGLGRCAHDLLSPPDPDTRVRMRPSLVARGSTGPAPRR
jgi:LacI family transcriptional regulator, galactose operon repressor